MSAPYQPLEQRRITHNGETLMPAPPRLSLEQLAQADMIAAEQHVQRAVDALSRALVRYTEVDRGEHAMTRLRGRNALRLITEALERIDTTNGEQFS